MNTEYTSQRGEQKWQHDVEVRLMGTPAVRHKGEEVSFPYQKVEGLFYYLCVNNQITRTQAIGVLWADSSETTARKNLRDALYNIRKVLGQDILIIEGNSRIALNRERDISIDIEQDTRENLLEKVRGEFLQFFYVKNCYEFEDWAEGERLRRRRDYIKALQLKIMELKPGEEPEFLEESGRIFLQQEWMDEEIYRCIMKKMAEAGRYSVAVELYQKLREFLKKEVGEEPEEETKNLFEKISGMKKSLKLPDLKTKDYFFGRTDILYDIYFKVFANEESDERSQVSYLITGEPGIGKSMLLEQIHRMFEKSDYLVFSWNCCETEKELYLMAWYGIMEAVAEYCKINGLTVDSPIDILQNHTDTDLRFLMTRFEVLTESVFRYLSKNFRNKKILLLIDDIQWMDPMSVRLMSNLLFRMGHGNLLVMAAYREEDGDAIKNFKIPLIGRGLLKEIILKPFTFAETQEIISQSGSGLEKDPVLAREIYEKTQGNPLFFMESLRLFDEGDTWEGFTDKTSNVLQSRLLRLSRRERTLLDILSIFSLPASLQEINQIFGLEDGQLRQILEPLLEKKILCEKWSKGEIRYGFRHQILHEYVYKSLSEEKRNMYHAYIARFYEERYRETPDLEICSLVLYHYEQCGNLYKTYEYKVKYLEPFYTITYALYPMLARKAVFSGNIDGYYAREDELVLLAEEIKEQQEEKPELAPIRMRIEYLLGRYEMFVADSSQGKKHVEKSLELARELQDRDYMFYNYLQLILYGDLTGQNGFMQDVIDTCMIFMKDCTHHHIEEECMLLRYLATSKVKNGEYAEAEKLYQEAINYLGGREEKKAKYLKELSACYHNMGLCYIRQKKWQEACGYLEQAIHLGEEYKIYGETGIFYSDMSFALYHLGEFEKAEQYAYIAKEYFAKVGSVWGEAKAERCIGIVLEAAGDAEEGAKHREISEKLAKRLGSDFLREELKRLEE